MKLKLKKACLAVATLVAAQLYADVASAAPPSMFVNSLNSLLKGKEMKQRQCIATVSLILALTGLSPVMAADAGMESGGAQNQTHPSNAPPAKFALSLAQMDEVHAGREITQAVYRVFLNGLKNCELNVQCIGGWQNALEWYANLP
jgi:hypothetical protein